MESVRHRMSRRRAAVVVAVAISMTLSACAGTSEGSAADPGDGGSAATDGGEITLLTHDSFAVDPQLLEDFKAETGWEVTVLAQGDAGSMVSTLALTKENPLGDAVFGIDSTFATRAIDAGVLAPYRSETAPDGIDDYAIGDENLLTAIDFGDVCLNIDLAYFNANGIDAPEMFDDLTDPTYRDMLVVTDPATSSPGLAFLLATVAAYGEDGWQDYWVALRDNGAKAVSGWTEAYTVDFSGSSGAGDRPIVLSYASSPPSEVDADGTPRTAALLDTCYRQVEYAGVLAGAENPEGAGELIDFMLSQAFQEQIPTQMWMYPVDGAVPLPADWAEFAPVATDPASVDPALIDAQRAEWIADWSEIMQG